VEFVAGSIAGARRVALLPGSFHPPTIAHEGLAQAALARVDAVVFVLPRAFPHKTYETVVIEDRLEMLVKLAGHDRRLAVAISDGGLFIEMARELRQCASHIETPFLLCGRDAAERIVSWKYSGAEPIEEQLAEYRLLAASRGGLFHPPEALAGAIETIEANWDDVSSTAVREAITNGAPWRHLVPERIHAEVEAVYSRSRLDSRKARRR
jgi:nicotinic acid mononucleotide adenylyltransferase